MGWKQFSRRWISALLLACLATLLQPPAARAQHGDYILGTGAVFGGGAQAPKGFYYQNLWSYYHASGSFVAETGPLKCGPLDRDCLGLNVSGSGSLDLFIDQNVFGWTSPYEILGANYGLLIDIPFLYADGSGAGSLQPVLTFSRRLGTVTGTVAGSTTSTSGESTKGSISAIYLEPINLGWHFKHLDATASSGVIMPSGGYDSSAPLNTGPGNAAGLFGLGVVGYPDDERSWSLSITAHYELYGSQIGRPYTLGDAIPFEWAAGKTFLIGNDILKQITLGAVGYAQWQVRNNAINLSPTRPLGISVLNTLQDTHSHIYSAGPAIVALTKYGLFSLRYFEEFGAKAGPSGRQLMFSFAF